MPVENQKQKFNWLQLIAIVVPIMVVVVSGWIAITNEVTELRVRLESSSNNKLEAKIDKVDDKVDANKAWEEEKHSNIWKVLRNKQDKPQSQFIPDE